MAFLSILNENKLSIDVLNLQETWLSESWLKNPDNLNLFQIPGYKLIPQGKICCAHGGLFTYVKDIYKATVRPLFKKSNLYEAIFVDIKSECFNGKVTVGNIYRPSTNTSDSNTEIETFINQFKPILEKLDREKSNLVISGDFNVNLLHTNQREIYQDYFDMFITRGLLPQATLPTRFSAKTATLIDNIFCKAHIDNDKNLSAILVSKLSDHFPVFTCLDIIKKPKSCPKYVYIQEKSPTAIQNFVSDVSIRLNEINFDRDLFTDPNANYDSFENTLSACKEKHLPQKKKRFSRYKHKLSPWITTEILNMIKFRDKLYKELKQTHPESIDHTRAKINLNNYSKLLQKNIRQAKKSYCQNQFQKYKFDSRKTWATINDILSRKKVKREFPEYFTIKNNRISNKQIIADEFNEFFTNIGPKLSNSIKSNCNLTYKSFLKRNITTTFNFDIINEKIVREATNDLQSKSSCGHDNISTILLKSLIPSISTVLTLVINQSLCTGIFPNRLKIAKVLPLYKKGDAHLFDNYRPISLLPAVSKIFEKIAYKQLYTYFTKNNLIYKSQYGFRQLHSTELAALEFSDRISNNLSNGEIPIAIFLDLSKAFDTLDHAILLSKLKYYGVKGSALNWFSSYLTNRCQYVNFDGVDSEMYPLSTGVPQGSVLGPLLFLIYMNDISEASDRFHSILFADDTTLTEPLCTFDLSATRNKFDKKNLSDNINLELQKIYDWLCVNKLSLNIAKTKFMIFHYMQRNISNIIPELHINNHIIERVKEFNFLGTIFDENLTWNQHTQKVANKISRTLGMLNRLKHTLPHTALKLLYNSLILPHLQYGILLWGFKHNRIFKLQKRAMRIITCSKYNAHTTPIFKSLCLLKIEEIFKLSLLKFFWKLENKKLPSYFPGMFAPNVATSHSHDTRYRLTAQTPVPRTASAADTIRYYLPQFLETAPNVIKNKVNTHSFKGFTHYAKMYYINSYSAVCDIPDCYICNLHDDS